MHDSRMGPRLYPRTIPCPYCGVPIVDEDGICDACDHEIAEHPERDAWLTTISPDRQQAA